MKKILLVEDDPNLGMLLQDYLQLKGIGAKKQEQLSDNLNAANVKFTTEELSTLDEISQLPAEYPGWILEYTKGDRKL